MYPVSELFLEAIESNTRSYFYSGTLTTSDGTVYEISNKDIVKGSGQIIRECSGNTEIEYGGVYAGELSITLYSSIDRYTLESAELALFFHLDIGNEYETIPLGVFEISEANRAAAYLELRAYDYMLRFDKSFDSTFTSGTAYDFLCFAASECNVILGNTQEEIEALPNATELLGIYADNDIETYRDLLHYLSQVLCAFCMIDREGKLIVKQFGTVPIMNIPAKERFSSSFSDFITRYSAINVTNMKTLISEYHALEIDDALTMNIGANPLLQLGLEETRLRLIQNILSSISAICYLPFDSSTTGNPALDLGDAITFSDGQADQSQVTVITSITTTLNGKQHLKCVGKNPRLSRAKSKNDKNISGLLQSVGSAKTAMYNYINAKAYTITDKPTEIVSLAFTSTEDTNAQFLAEILLSIIADEIEQTASASTSITIDEQSIPITMDFPYTTPGDCTIGITYYLNGYPISTFLPVETLRTGKHIITLYYPITNVKAKTYNTFSVYMHVVKGGAASIDKTQIHATITGQGLVSGENEWNGRIEVFDEMHLQTLSIIPPKYSDDSISIMQIPYNKAPFTESMAHYTKIGLSVVDIANDGCFTTFTDYEEKLNKEGDESNA